MYRSIGGERTDDEVRLVEKYLVKALRDAAETQLVQASAYAVGALLQDAFVRLHGLMWGERLLPLDAFFGSSRYPLQVRVRLDTPALQGPAHTPGDCATAQGTERPRFRAGSAQRQWPSFHHDKGAPRSSRRPRKEVRSKMELRPLHSNAQTCAETWCTGRAREPVQWRSARQEGSSAGRSARAGRSLPGRSSDDDGRQRATRAQKELLWLLSLDTLWA